MFCQNCGNQVVDESRFCNKCGMAIVIATPSVQASAVAYQQNDVSQQPVCTSPKQNYDLQHGNVGAVPKLSMGWYKYVIYVVQFVSLIFNLIFGGYALITPNFASVVIFGLGLVMLGAIGIITFVQLIKYKKSALTWLIGTYIATISFGMIVLILCLAGSTASSIVGTLFLFYILIPGALIGLASVYKNKCGHLYVN